MKTNITEINRGISQDTSYQNQPKGSYPFALNAILSNEDSTFIGNEQSNEIISSIPTGYSIIGSTYMSNGETALFLVNGDSCEIGIHEEDGTYSTKVNTSTLGFSIDSQIDCIYRLRRGCERTIYFTDGLNKPRIYNFDKPYNFKTNNSWDSDKFNLFKEYQSIPEFININVETGGDLLPGSYNASIQYLDEDLNPTEWITTSDVINIYNSSTTDNWKSIKGSTGEVDDYHDFGKTDKKIKFQFDNLDTSFPFYRVAMIEATSGTGFVSKVVYSAEISTNTIEYTYSGTGQTIGTEEEILFFNNIIETAEHIEQVENRLILANTTGKQTDFCAMQQYASKVQTDVVLKNINLNALTSANAKSPTANFEGIGYMPGEMYSFGLVYVFKDRTVSPAYHIPGKNATTAGNVFSPGVGVHPMSTDNKLKSTNYLDNSSCGSDTWGRDSEGSKLKNTPIRHHRFPLRSEIGEDLYNESNTSPTQTITNNILTLRSNIHDQTIYDAYVSADDRSATYSLDVVYQIDTGSGFGPDIVEQFVYTVAGTSVLDIELEKIEGAVYKIIELREVTEKYTFDINGNIATTTYLYSLPFYLHSTNPDATATSNSFQTGLTYSLSQGTETITIEDKLYTTNILGVKFSNIELPDASIIGEEVIGYYIVRNERTSDNTTIVDSGVIHPLTKSPNFITNGTVIPNIDYLADYQKDTFGVISPEYLFKDNKFTGVTDVIQQGYYTEDKACNTTRSVFDASEGSSYNPEVHDKSEESYGALDGVRLRAFNIEHQVSYTTKANVFSPAAESKEMIYLNSMGTKNFKDYTNVTKELVNFSHDNKGAFLKINANASKSNEKHHSWFYQSPSTWQLPYVVFKKDLDNPYANFRNLPYYKDSHNVHLFNGNTSPQTIELWAGDSHVTPLRYNTGSFYDNKLRKREGDSGATDFVIGSLALIAGVVVAATVPEGLTAGLTIARFGLTKLATGAQKNETTRAYGALYDAGLQTSLSKDTSVKDAFDGNPIDDEIQWYGSTVSTLWIESKVNMGLRYDNTLGYPSFLEGPNTNNVCSSSAETVKYMLDKLTDYDETRKDKKLYTGFLQAEGYNINKDFERGNKQKVYHALGIEYDCCSSCKEEFPHRIHYSEQSFQEELSDNFRTFLPNNYRDIEGNSGAITDLFRMKTNLYIHTEEGLWHLPQNYQERITGDIISFIGTGSYFSTPPRKIVEDATGNQGGSRHKWGLVKTPYGVFYPCEAQGTMFHFDGKGLKPVSSKGLNAWFKKNMFIANKDYDNNPSNILGSGFISVYDSENERVLFTKVDKDQYTDSSWTISYSLKTQTWISWHSYLPNHYTATPNHLFSWKTGDDNMYIHNVKNSYQTFYGQRWPHIVELVSLSNPLTTKIYDNVTLLTEAQRYDADSQELVDARFITYNQAIIYNNRQCSGLIDLVPRDIESSDFLSTSSTVSTADIRKTEGNWKINSFRDIRTDYVTPIFNKEPITIAGDYYIDKVLNNFTLDVNKDWTQLESFRGKYLVIRLIFNTFEDIKLIMNYSGETEQDSHR